VTHPEQLLADYVEGALADEQRALVEAHLAGCATCREEVELARGAVAALAALEEEAVPFGVTGPVLAEAGRRFEHGREVRWQRLQWAAGLGVAASLVLVVALNLGGDDVRPEQAAVTAADAELGAAAPEAAPSQLEAAFRGLEDQQAVNYDDAGILALAQDAVPLITGSEALGGADATLASPDEALACIEASGAPTVEDPRDVLIRLIAAAYEGTPAYIAVYAEGPGAGQPPDRVVVWAVDQASCQILTTASLRI
jgi:hypothetical protein